MPKRSSKSEDELRGHIKDLAINYHYLPYGHVHDLGRIPEKELCGDIDCIKRRAIEILTSESEDAEVYRQLIYMLSTHNIIVGLTPYILALARTMMIKEPSTSTLYRTFYIGEVKSKIVEWRKKGYRKAVKAYGNLIQLDFAYAPLFRYVSTGLIFDEFPKPKDKQPTHEKVLGATIQSKLVRIKLPLRPFEPTTLDSNVAERIVNFSVELRRKVIEGFLRFRPRRVSDIFNYVYQWAKRETENLRLRDLNAGKLDDYIYDELFIAPYYLSYYGVLSIDLIRYDLYWEIEI
jgi:hypothetical protein